MPSPWFSILASLIVADAFGGREPLRHLDLVGAITLDRLRRMFRAGGGDRRVIARIGVDHHRRKGRPVGLAKAGVLVTEELLVIDRGASRSRKAKRDDGENPGLNSHNLPPRPWFHRRWPPCRWRRGWNRWVQPALCGTLHHSIAHPLVQDRQLCRSANAPARAGSAAPAAG